MNKSCGFLLLIIILISCNSGTTDKTSSPTNDSIQKYLALAGNDTLDFDKRIKYNDKALSFLDLERNDSLTREYLNLVVYNYLITKDLIKLKKTSSIYFKKINAVNDTLGFARYYRYKGGYFNKTQVWDSSFFYYRKSENLYKKIKDKEGLAKVNLLKAMVQDKLNDHLGCELSVKKAYLFYKNKKENNYEFMMCNIVLGNNYHELKEYDKAIQIMKTALNLVKRNNIQDKKNNLRGTCLNNIGNSYREQKNYLKAGYYFKLALSEEKKPKDPELYGYILNNLGYCYLKTNSNDKLPYIFYKADKIFDSLKIKNERSVININLSEYFLKEKDSIKGRQYAEKAVQFAKESKATHYYLTALSHAGSINPKKAPTYIKEYHRINDSILFAERVARNEYYKIQLETEEITQQKDIALKHRAFVIVVAIFLLFISILIFIIARQRLKQKELHIKQTEQKASEEIYQLMLNQEDNKEKARQIEKKRIGLELHDGIINKLVSTRLNLSILTINRDETTIKKCLDYIKNIQNIEKEIRNVAHDLNQEAFLNSNSFSRLLNNITDDLNKTSSTIFKIDFNDAIDWNTISNTKKMNLYRIIQEASHNIIKHAKAKKAAITILMDDTRINLSVTDDGIGFKTSDSENGIGLKNMKYRIKTLKGKFEITSKPNLGTSINISIPKKD
ncbi:ATP-binding protein [Flavobacterium sp.]|uniref:tetratricopeptide repeat-containing sensor histidine kinase n=1 Tax=Flavobacterium sp. TaxID=239 RepID=UPI003919AE2E